MVKFAAIAAAAALAGQVTAQVGDTCFLRRSYCGGQLLAGQGQNYELWLARVDEALIADGLPTDGTHRYNTLFVCIGPTSLGVAQYCPATGLACQPSNSDACGHNSAQNSCCGK
ncbi:hypothetical protein RB595_005990 [Gaeumannomyces hyphopodioides]